MQFVVVDTSVVAFRDWRLTSPAASALLAAAGRGELTLVVPDVVVRELAKKFAVEERDALSKLEQGFKDLANLSDREQEAVIPHPLGPEYAENLRTYIRLGGGVVAPIPAADHSALVDAALAGRKPFKPDGKAGYRDALIWETFVVQTGGADAVFVTNDGDFLDSSRSRLHPDLIADLRTRGMGESVRIANSLHAAVELVIDPAESLKADLQHRLTEDADFRATVLKQLRDALPYGADDHDVAADGYLSEDEPWIDEVTDSSLDDLVELEEPAVMSVYQAREGEYVVEIAVSATAVYAIEFTIDWPRTWPGEQGLPDTISLSADERRGASVAFASVTAVFDAILHSADSRLDDIRCRLLLPA